MTDVAETTATTTSDSEAGLPNGGLRGYCRPVSAARPWPWPLQAFHCIRMEARGQRQPAGSVRDSRTRRVTPGVMAVYERQSGSQISEE